MNPYEPPQSKCKEEKLWSIEDHYVFWLCVSIAIGLISIATTITHMIHFVRWHGGWTEHTEYNKYLLDWWEEKFYIALCLALWSRTMVYVFKKTISSGNK